MKKLSALFILIAIIGTFSISAYAHHNDYMGFGFSPFGYGYGFGGYGMEFGYGFGGFGHEMDFGGFAGANYGMGFGGRFGGYGMGFASFNGFGHDFTAHTAVPNSIRKIVPIPASASATNSSITYDENGEIHVRPFDDEDLFVED